MQIYNRQFSNKEQKKNLKLKHCNIFNTKYNIFFKEKAIKNKKTYFNKLE